MQHGFHFITNTIKNKLLSYIDLKIRYFKTMSTNKRQIVADTVESIFRNSILIALYGNTLNTRIQI